MTRFQTKVAKASDSFVRNRADMLLLVEELRAIEARAVTMSDRRRERFEKRGQLTPRDRLGRLLDAGMPFLELFNLAGFLVDDPDRSTSVPGASAIAGIGFVSGARCMVMVDDSGISAGAHTLTTADKTIALLDICLRQKLPFVHLVESGGGNLVAYKVESWAEGGGIFYRLARLSAMGVPTFVVLHGPSTAAGAYHPGLCDCVIGVRRNGMAALAGPALTKAATGEVADAAELGGAEMHASVSGLVEYLADDDADGIAICRDLIARLDWNAACPRANAASSRPPEFDPDELAGVVPVDYRQAYDVREVIARIVDGSDFVEFKPRFGPATVCAHARIFGHAVGIIGNNGPLDPNGSAKATHFFQMCDKLDAPIIFLNNITGFIVGVKSERAGMIKIGSKMIQAVANVTVPKISLYVGASFGAGNFGMCGHSFEPDFLFSWPNATTGTMGAEQAAQTMDLVARDAAARKGAGLSDEQEARLRQQKEAILDVFKPQSSALFTSGKMLDQGVIDPRDTRKILGFALDTCREGRVRTVRPNSYGTARI